MTDDRKASGIVAIENNRGAEFSIIPDATSLPEIKASGDSMERKGWIKLHRRILDSGFWKKSEYVHLWILILLKANHTTTEFVFNGKTLKLLPGQFLTGRHSLSVDSTISPSKVERILKYLENEHQIEQQKTNKFRIITVKEWKKYQSVNGESGQQNGQQVDNKWTTTGQQSGHIQEVLKNDKNDKNDKKEKEGVVPISLNNPSFLAAIKKDNPPLSKKIMPIITKDNITKDSVISTKVKITQEQFDAFWDEYPRRNGRKVGKSSAFEQMKKNIKPEELPALMTAVKHYKVADTIAKDAERFLKKDYWRDWIEKPLDSDAPKHYEV